MKKVRNVIFLAVFIFMAMFVYSCTTIKEENKAEYPEYTVFFKNADGSTYKKVTNFIGVELRKYQIPEVPEMNGHTGKWVNSIGQDAKFEGVNDNQVFYAQYEAMKYKVTFYDLDGNKFASNETWQNEQMVTYTKAAKAPEVELEGYTLYWDKEFSNVTSDLDVYLQKTLNSYNVKFMVDGVEVSEESVFYGYAATKPLDPTKAEDAQYTYTFAGWDMDADGVAEAEPYIITKDTVFTPVFDAHIKKYMITFESEGVVVATRNTDYGTLPVAPLDPTKAATQQYTYTFAGWDMNADGVVDDIAPVTGTLTYVAVFTSTLNPYEVKFVDHDGTVLDTQTVLYGNSAQTPTSPTRTGYTFTGWDKAFTNIQDDLVVNATYSINQYTYSFYDEDRVTLLKQETVDYQTTIVAPANPTKASNAEFDYAFAGWDKAFDKMPAEDLAIYATYSATTREYMVSFYNEDDTLISESIQKYGVTAALPQTLPTKVGYTLVGWLVNGATTPVETFTVEGVTSAKAFFEINHYSVIGRITFNVGGGNVSYLDKLVVKGYYGQTGLDIEAAIQSISWEREGYNLVGWKLSDGTDVSIHSLNNFTMPAEDTYLYPQYEIKTYEVKFVDSDDTVISTQTVEWGKDAVAPANPQKAQTAEFTYTFLAWSKAYTNVKEDLVVKAIYQATKRKYTVTFLDDKDEVIGTSTVDYGTPGVEPESMQETYIGYTWTWDGDFSCVTDNMSVKATFAKKVYKITIYIGDMYYTYTRYYGDVFNPLEEIPLGGGNIELTGNLTVKSSSSTTSQTYYVGQYVVENVDEVSFDAEYIIK